MLNKVVLMGNLTRDPELRHTTGGTAVCRFTVAVSRNFVRQGEERQTDFINVVAWGKTAELVNNYFPKGRMIAVCGRIETRTWDDQEGKRHYVTEVIAEEVHFTGNKSDSNNNDNRPSAGFNNQPSQDIEGFMPIEADDDLPF